MRSGYSRELRSDSVFAPRLRIVRARAEHERALIEAALSECRGRVSGPAGAAAKLGLPRQTLESKIKTLGIPLQRRILLARAY
jgi:DNA-binding NtrC family response regulator